jgi:hypothetical protein
MSNSFDTSSGPVAALWDTIPQVAYAMARGKDGMADSANDMFTLVSAGSNIETAGMAGAFYREVRSQAERIATSKGKPLKEQTSKSYASQVSKLENFPLLGECARINVNVAVAFEYAREVTGSGYTKLVKAAVALKTVLAKDINADEVTLCAAVDASQAEKAEVASEVIAKMGEALGKLVHGDDKNLPKHEPLFTALLATYPADYVERAQQALATLATCVAAVEAANAAKIVTSK